MSGAIAATSQATGTLIIGGGLGCAGDCWGNLFQAVSGVIINPLQTGTQSAFQTTYSDGLQWLDGSFTIVHDFYGSNATPVRGVIEINNGSKSTSSNSMYIGTFTNNDLRLGTNDGTNLTIQATTGRVGIGTTSPLYELYVGITVSTTIDAGSTGVAYFKQSGGLISTTGPISSVPIAIACAGSMLSSTAYYTYSDRRLKHSFEPVEDSVCDGLLQIEPCMFKYKTDSEDSPMHLGYCAQDMLKANLYHCINYVSNPDLHVEDEKVDLEGLQMTVDYGKVSCLLHKLILRQQAEIDDLRAKISTLI
ncbi:hypothetical protein ON010_g11206 [Phytophthora cinnamomi]|nr:hypothetical protein ON010_g11206 [Phytophthora cinnamomi]